MSPVRVALPVLLLFAFPAAAQQPQPAPLDPEADRPYVWRVVVQVRPHPVLTADLRARLRQELRDTLQAGLGPLGAVDVIDLAALPRTQWEPLWQQFDDKGFAALDAPREVSGVKTHFLRLEYRDGLFHLEARQHDGFTGLASAVVRHSQAVSPEMLGRSAVLLLDRDFGVCGTIEPLSGRKDEVRVRLRGARLGPLDRYLAVGDVFAVAAIRRTTRAAAEPVRTATGKIVTPPPGSTPPPALQPLPRSEPPSDFTYLKVTEIARDGTCTCSVLTRYQDPFRPRPGLAGYRCLKLTTSSATAAVRLVGSDGKPHQTASPFKVWATDTRFTADPAAEDYLDSQGGVFRSRTPLTGVACVVVGGESGAERFPVPVLGPEPVTLRFELKAAAEEKAAYERAVRAVAIRAADARAAQAGCFDATAKLIEARKNPDALARATAGFRATDAAIATLTDDVQRLREDLHKSPDAEQLLAGIEQQIGDLREGNAALAGRIKDLEAVVARETGPAADALAVQADALNVRIGILIGRGDIDEALAAYDQLITLLPGNADVKARRDKLKAEWQPKTPEHVKARDYLFKTWPGLNTLAEFKAALPEVRSAVEVCKAAGDRHGLRKLQTSLPAFAVKLEDQIKALDPATDAGKQGFDDAKAVRDEMVKIEQEITAILRQPGK